MRGIITPPQGVCALHCCTTPEGSSTGCMVKMTGWMLKTETGKRLKAQLLKHTAYASRPKMADEAVKLLAYVASRTNKNTDGIGVGVHHHLIRNRFRGGVAAVRECKQALFELGLLEVTRDPLPGVQFTHYRATDRMVDAYESALPEERQLLGYEGNLCKGADAEKRRRRRLKALALTDPFCRAHELLCCSVEVGWSWAKDEDYRQDEPGEVTTALDILGHLTRVDFDTVKRGKKSSRLFHPLVNFPSTLRSQLHTKERIYAGEVDIRACWPTFLPAQLLDLNKDGDEAFKTECAKWQEAFCKPGEENDPRKAILKDTGLSISQKVLKECLNKYLNGSIQVTERKDRAVSLRYKTLDAWFARAYPRMHKAWKVAKPETLGEKIGHNFETPLMTHSSLYEYAEEKGIMLYYQYDGFGVFARPEDKANLKELLEGLCRLMTEISEKKLGVPIVVRSKLVD